MLVFDQLKRSDWHLRMIAIGILAGMGILLLGLWYVQVFSSKRYVQDLRRQAYRTVRIPAPRGKILDRYGEPLAENRPSYSIRIYLEELRTLFQDEFARLRPAGRLTRAQRSHLGERARYSVASNIVSQLAARLELPIVLDEKQFHRHFTNRLALPLPVLENLTDPQIARFLELGPNPPGVDLVAQPLRYYPRQTLAGHVLGYLKPTDRIDDPGELAEFHYRMPDYEGRVGVEWAFDKDLRGRAGAKSMLVNSLGYRQSETIWLQAEPGKNLVLTLDRRLQESAEGALRTFGPQARGAAVVLDPRNGDVLALASAPPINPNQLLGRISHEDWERLSDPKLRPQLNRATQGIYPPGSILKIMVSLALFEAGIDPNEIIHSKGYYELGRRKIADTARPGEYDFERALIHSCNTYFIQQGLRAGIDRLLDLGQRLHLGHPSELGTNQDSRGVFPTRAWIREERARGNPWTDGDTANLCIGQGPVAVTPMQVAVMTAAIANGGSIFKPRLVQRIEPQDPTLDKSDAVSLQPVLRGNARLNPDHLAWLRQAMLKDVEDPAGTGKEAFVPGMRICGKTGTAEVKRGGSLVDKITWFVSFAPLEGPTHVVVVMVESGGSGGGTCAPLARQIYRAIQQSGSAQTPAEELARSH